MSIRDNDKQKVYDAERFAFKGTPLADSLREDDITAEYNTVRESALWPGRRFEIRKARVDMTEAGGKAGFNHVRTSAARVRRYVVSHECAHLLHRLDGRTWDQAAHGYRFRQQHVRTAGLIYGVDYADMLLGMYKGFGLEADDDLLDRHVQPIIDIDALSIATAPTGGWKRFR